MPHFMIVLILYINLLNLSWIKKCLFLRNMEPLNIVLILRTASFIHKTLKCMSTKMVNEQIHRDVFIIFSGI